MTKAQLLKTQSQMLAVLNREFPALQIAVNGGTCGMTESTVKFTIAERDNEQVRREEWERYAEAFGLPINAFGKVFVDRGDRWIITGIKISRSKYPVIAQCLTGNKTGETSYFNKQAALRSLSSATA